MANFNFENLLKLGQVWNTFTTNHPKFPEFLKAVENRPITEGTAVDLCITYPDGKTVKTHVSLRESDLALVDVLRSLQ